MSAHVLLSGLILPFLAHAAPNPPEPAVPTYVVSMKLHDGIVPLGTPALRVKAGEPAVIDIGDAEGHRYSVRLTVKPGEDDTLFVESAIDVVTREGSYSAQPAMTVRSGLPAGILVGMVRDESQPFRIDLTVNSVRAR